MHKHSSRRLRVHTCVSYDNNITIHKQNNIQFVDDKLESERRKKKNTREMENKIKKLAPCIHSSHNDLFLFWNQFFRICQECISTDSIFRREYIYTYIHVYICICIYMCVYICIYEYRKTDYEI